MLISIWFVNILLNLDQGHEILLSLWGEVSALLVPTIQWMDMFKYYQGQRQYLYELYNTLLKDFLKLRKP